MGIRFTIQVWDFPAVNFSGRKPIGGKVVLSHIVSHEIIIIGGAGSRPMARTSKSLGGRAWLKPSY
jgi:hypothetical protein